MEMQYRGSWNKGREVELFRELRQRRVFSAYSCLHGRDVRALTSANVFPAYYGLAAKYFSRGLHRIRREH